MTILMRLIWLPLLCLAWLALSADADGNKSSMAMRALVDALDSEGIPIETALSETSAVPQPVATPKPADPPTSPPEPAPTPPPVSEPTEKPTDKPTEKPIEKPTDPPTEKPIAPEKVAEPTSPPTVTAAPVAKVEAPTAAPTTKSSVIIASAAPVTAAATSAAPVELKAGETAAPIAESTTEPPTKPPRHISKAPITTAPVATTHAPSPDTTTSPITVPPTAAPVESKPPTNAPTDAIVSTPKPSVSEYEPSGTERPTPSIDMSPTMGEGGSDIWGSEPTESPIPYIPPEDDVLVSDQPESDWSTPNESLQQMEHDQHVLIALLTVFGVMLLFSIIVAHQMLNNPDGFCARYVLSQTHIHTYTLVFFWFSSSQCMRGSFFPITLSHTLLPSSLPHKNKLSTVFVVWPLVALAVLSVPFVSPVACCAVPTIDKQAICACQTQTLLMIWNSVKGKTRNRAMSLGLSQVQ